MFLQHESFFEGQCQERLAVLYRTHPRCLKEVRPKEKPAGENQAEGKRYDEQRRFGPWI